MTISRFIDIQEEVKRVICNALDKMIVKSFSDYVLLLARADYHEWLDRSDIDVTPYILEDGRYRLIDSTRQRFLDMYFEKYVNRLISNKTCEVDEREYDLNIQMMIYSHIWESALFLKQLERIALVLNGEKFNWNRKFEGNSVKSQFIEECMLKKLESTDKGMWELISNCYSRELRNEFAHSTYQIQMSARKIVSHNNGLYQGKPVSFDEWDEMFVKSVMLSSYLNHITNERKNLFIKDYGDGPILIKLPMKGKKKKCFEVYIHPVYDDVDTRRVKFYFMTQEEMDAFLRNNDSMKVRNS